MNFTKLSKKKKKDSHSSKGGNPFEKRGTKPQATKLSGILDEFLSSNLELIDIGLN